MKRTVFLDIEVFPNYFLLVAKSDHGMLYVAEMHNDQLTQGARAEVRGIFKWNSLVTFNGNNYDLPIIGAWLKDASNERLYHISRTIVETRIMPWEIPERFPDAVYPACDHIDLAGVTPLTASLKAYACRIHASHLQDLPLDPHEPVTEAQLPDLLHYCKNDVDLTIQIYEHMRPQIDLRRQMTRLVGTDLRSKSDPQIAEAIFRQRLGRVERRKRPVGPFYFEAVDFIDFHTPTLDAVYDRVLDTRFEVNKKGVVELPDALDFAIEFGGASYKLGIGGLHSQEKHQAIVCGPDQHLGDLDVTSYYPSIIIGQQLRPEHLADNFIDVYRDIYDERLMAKQTGDMVTSDTLKIVLNGSFGKFGSVYSFLYSPELLIQTTLTGQLCLLMLIERLTAAGARVTSANTDGIVVLFDKDVAHQVKHAADRWQHETAFNLEWTPYKAVYSESVNSYIAIKPDGKAKRKGTYEAASIRKGYARPVITNAIEAYLDTGYPIEDSIYDCPHLHDFMTMRGVRGGAVWREQELGRVVRWYRSTDGEPIRYKTNGNKVAGSDGAVPLMNMPKEFPADLDYDWYVDTAKRTLKKLGVNQ